MNKIFTTVWSESRQAWMVTSELASGGGRPKLTPKKSALALLLGAVLLQSGPVMAVDYTNETVQNGTQNVGAGDTATSTIISSDGTQNILSGGSAISTEVSGANATQQISAGGSVTSTIVKAAGVQSISSGGLATYTTLDRGTLNILSGGAAVSAIINHSQLGAGQGTGINVYSGGFLRTALNDGGDINIFDGGSATDLTVQSGGRVFVTGVDASASTVTINSSGTVDVASGGAVTSSTVNSGGHLYIGPRQFGTDRDISHAFHTIINNGGSQNVRGNAVSHETIINSGGVENISTGGTASSSILNTGGMQNVYFGGRTSNTTINGGTQILNGNGWEKAWAETTIVNDGGVQEVTSTSLASNTIINSGGSQKVFGQASIMTVSGSAIVFTAEAIDAIINNGGIQYISNKGKVTSTTINTGGIQEILSFGFATGTTINSGGQQSISSGGSATITNINSGGRADITDGGTATSTTVDFFGTLQVSAGGTALDVTQNSGGALVTNTDANVSGTNALAAFFVDGSRGSASNVLLENGGILDVLANGFASDTTVRQDGLLRVTSGGQLSGHTIIENGGVLSGSNVINNGNLHYLQHNSAVYSGNLTGTGRLTQDGGRLTLEGSLSQDEGLFLNSGGVLTLNNLQADADVTAQSGTELYLTGNTTLTGIVDPTDMTLNSGTIWNMTGDSLLDTLTNAGSINVTHGHGSFTPMTLATTNLNGSGGSITLHGILGDSSSPMDKVVIDGGRATGNTNLIIVNEGGLGAPTTGNGIEVVEAINGGTTDASAFGMKSPLDVGAYRYSLQRNVNENWYLATTPPTNSSGGTVTPPTNSSGGTVTPPTNSSGGTVTPPTNSSGGTVTPPTNSSGGTVTPPTNSSGGTVTPPTNSSGGTVTPPTNSSGGTVTPPTNSSGGTVTPPTNSSGGTVTPPANSSGGTNNNYSNAAWLYTALPAQAMDYDRQVLGDKDSRRSVVSTDANTGREVWGRMRSGHLNHDGSGNSTPGGNSDSNSEYAFIQMGSDVFVQERNDAQWRTGIYGAAGSIRGDIRRGDDGQSAGTIDDSIYTAGLYLNATFNNGLYVDNILQVSRHKTTSVTEQNTSMESRGTGLGASLEAGWSLPVWHDVFIEPQAQYIWQSLDLDSAVDSSGTAFSAGSSQLHQVRVGARIGSSTSHQDLTEKNPISFWVKPSLLQSFNSSGDVNIGVSGKSDTEVSFSPDQNGTALLAEAGADIAVGKNGTLGVRGGYMYSVKGVSAEGYYGQLNMKIRF